MTEDQFRQLRDAIQQLEVSTTREFGAVNERLSALETGMKDKASKGDVFRTVFLVNGGFIGVTSVVAMASRTFGVV